MKSSDTGRESSSTHIFALRRSAASGHIGYKMVQVSKVDGLGATHPEPVRSLPPRLLRLDQSGRFTGNE
jgi:hypothetical protein